MGKISEDWHTSTNDHLVQTIFRAKSHSVHWTSQFTKTIAQKSYPILKNTNLNNVYLVLTILITGAFFLQISHAISEEFLCSTKTPTKATINGHKNII